MASLQAVLLPAKALKSGENAIRISIAHNGETRYLRTNIVLNSAEELTNGQIVRRKDANFLNIQLSNLLTKLRSAILEFEYIDGLTCAELLYNLKNIDKMKNRTISSIFYEYIENSARLKPASIRLYNSLFNSINSIVGGGLMIEKVNRSTVMWFEKSLVEIGNSPATIKTKLDLFSKLVSYAKRCGYATYKIDPFAGYMFPAPDVRDCWLSTSDIKRIRDAKLKKSTAKCRDIFMLSYYLGGINAADLVKLNLQKCIDTRTIRYTRTKTERVRKINKVVEFYVPEEAIEVMERIKAHDGLLNVSKYDREHKMHEYLARNLKRIAEAVDIEHIIYYSARKSFAQHAFQLGVSTGVIDYILGHKLNRGGTSLYSYITVTPEMATKAIRQVLDNLK